MGIPPFANGPPAPLSRSLSLPQGLDRFQFGLGRVGKGNGGIDIGIYGDSKDEGTGASDYWHRWPHQLKLILQQRLNPVGVQGGFGYVPSMLGDDTDNMTQDPAASWTVNTNGIGPGTRSQNSSFSSNRYTWQMDGSASDAAYKRANVSSFEVLARRATDGGTARIDVGTGSVPAIGAGGVLSTTINTNGSSSYGRHWGNLGSGSISRTANNFWSFAAPAASNKFYFDGSIFYDGDENCGVRVHNLANAGTKTDAYIDGASPLALENGQVTSNFQFFGSSADTDTTTQGASRLKLGIFNWITNDQGGSQPPVTDLNTFIYNYGLMVDSVLAQASAPSVLIVIPPIAGGAGSAARVTQSQSWVPAIKAMAAQRQHVAVLDLWAAMGSTTRALSVDVYGMAADSLHENDYGQRWIAEEVARAILYGVI